MDINHTYIFMGSLVLSSPNITVYVNRCTTQFRVSLHRPASLLATVQHLIRVLKTCSGVSLLCTRDLTAYTEDMLIHCHHAAIADAATFIVDLEPNLEV